MLTSIPALVLLFMLCHRGEAEYSKNDTEQMRTLYNQFLHDYRRTNITEDEYKFRFAIFQKNMLLIDELNSRNDSIVYGITQFADWTDSEYNNYMNTTSGDDRKFRGGSLHPRNWIWVRWNGESYPSHWDWRRFDAVTDIKSQEYKCNSCWAYAVTGVVESLYAIKYGDIINISEYEMLDCDFSNDGCYSGSTRRAMGRGKFHGFTETRFYSFMRGHPYQCPRRGTIFVKNLFALSPDANTIAWFTANYGPVALNVAIPPNYKFYKSGIMRDSYECWQMQPNHAAEVVGFGVEDGIEYWIMKNSWGSWWGENGFFRIERGKNACQVETFATSASV
uniref:Cysteine proteinase n=1 Tax=Ascaris suum TaxID=6253 RepID=F1LAH9_ASCSU